MATKIVVPELGESVIEATVGRWMKQEGDQVKVGEPLVSLETDKVDLEVGAQRAGILSRIEHKEGEDVKIGDVLAIIEDLPEGTGDASRDDGKSRETVQPKEMQQPQAILAESRKQPPEPEARQPEIESVPQEEKVTPLARRLAEEKGIDISRIEGSGPKGRITKQDVLRFQGSVSQERPAGATPAPTPEPQPAEKYPAPEAALEDRREVRQRMSRRRRTIAQRLLEAQQTTAMLTTFNDVEMSAVMDLRRRRRDEFKERYATGLGIVSFFVKASIGALKQFPEVNAEIQEDEIVLKYYYDIGVAIGAEEGLVVPVLRDADRMSFGEIERAIKDYVQKSQTGTLSIEELRGGTFTITNGGVFGSLLSTPILNPPQSGILGLHRIEDRAVVRDDQVVIRPMMYLALSYDHRIIDGRLAVQFLIRIKELIEDPEKLLLEA